MQNLIHPLSNGELKNNQVERTNLFERVTKDFKPSGIIHFKNLELTKYYPVAFGILSGFSVFYFLYFFEAYGIQKGLSYSGHSHLFRSISFGVLTFTYLSVFETWLRPNWAKGRWLNQTAWYVSLVMLGSHLIFLLFNYFWNWQEWNLEAYGLIIKEFPLMMVLPLSFYLVLKATSKPKGIEADYLIFQSENGKDFLKVNLSDFMFANSSDNYITIFYLSQNQSKQHLIRKPLKVLEEELKNHDEIERTHRSYLVNRRNIQSITQLKGKVHVEINGHRLPVSKQFQTHFLN